MAEVFSMAPEPKKPQPFHFGEPEKTNWLSWILFALFVVLSVLLIVWLYTLSPSQPTLTCHGMSGNGLWSAFGRCVENQ